jgi:phosphotriesterase-related protein
MLGEKAKTDALAMTVLGPVAVSGLGVVLPHEHLLIELRTFVTFDDPDLRRLQEEPVSLENLGWVRQYWTYNADNMVLRDADLALAEAARFKRAGGGTIVDVTLPEIGRGPDVLVRVARATGLHIVMGCGAYVASRQSPQVRAASADELARIWIAEAEQGVDGVDGRGVRAGIIGEIGCSWPLEEVEAKALRAAALTQRQTGLAISVHPGRNRAAPGPICDILADAGADLRRVVLGHIERTIQSLDGLCELASRGVYVEFDCFGLETSFYPVPGVVDVDMPSDAQRLDLVRGLLDAEYGAQVLLSHDICTKHRLARYGGHGYDHLLTNVRPWMRQRGFSEPEIDLLLVSNPASVLAMRGGGSV